MLCYVSARWWLPGGRYSVTKRLGYFRVPAGAEVTESRSPRGSRTPTLLPHLAAPGGPPSFSQEPLHTQTPAAPG